MDRRTVLDALKENAELRKLGAVIEEGGPGKWNALRAMYKIVTPGIEAKYPRPYTPYRATDWRFLTPIEVHAWNAIRRYGIPFYPQYPIGRVFVDFADPVRHVAIECDGKQWHDAAKDAIRDRKLGDLGWTVHRFNDRRCALPEDHPESIDSFLLELSRMYVGLPGDDE